MHCFMTLFLIISVLPNLGTYETTGILPEIVVTAPRHMDNSYESTGILQEIVVTAPRYIAPLSELMPKMAYANPLSKMFLISDLDNNINVKMDITNLKAGENYHLGSGDTAYDDVTITGGNGLIEGYIDADLTVMGGTVDISGIITGDVAVMGGNMVNAGRINGDAAIFGGTATNRGEIKGDLAMFGGSVMLDSGSYIGGDIAMIGGSISRDSNATVIGEISSIKISGLDELGPRISRVLKFPKIVTRGASVVGRLVFLMIMAVFYLLHLLTIIIFPDFLERISNRLKMNIWIGLGIGLGIQVLYIPIILVLTVSIIGILIVPLFVLAVALAILFGFTALSTVVGEKVIAGFNWKISSRIGIFSLGYLALMLIPLLVGLIGPQLVFIGIIIYYVAATIGSGAAVYTILRKEKKAGK